MTPADNPLAHHFHTMAANNLWANHRLLSACKQLSQADFEAARTSFFPSLKATLNHILVVDWFYVDAMERELRGEPPHPTPRQFFTDREPCASAAVLYEAQRAVDARLLAYCDALTDAHMGRTVTILRGPGRTQRDTRTRLLAHVFQHQIHHRGQAHAMLAGTGVAPPQLDDFFCALDAPLRVEDFAALGLTEAYVFGAQA